MLSPESALSISLCVSVSVSVSVSLCVCVRSHSTIRPHEPLTSEWEFRALELTAGRRRRYFVDNLNLGTNQLEKTLQKIEVINNIEAACEHR